MTSAEFAKRYPDQRHATMAIAHRDWLSGLESGVRLPALRSATARELVFEHLGTRHPDADDLADLAQALGRLHAAAYLRHLHAARLDEPFHTRHGLTITDFITPRRTALEKIPLPVTGRPAALYKDANIRNFLLTDDGVAIVDFDDLTLAPFGYDLAKLVVSAAMTHGRLDPHMIELALDTYNSHTAEVGRFTECPMRQLRVYAEFHHLLTAPYLHRNGYRHPWPRVRPWPAPEAPQ
ncbi:MAG: phosphotransferase [Pseudonocardiaceae bacterium]